MDYVTIISGGMDSVTLAHALNHEGLTQHLVSFDYGQRHRKELDYAAGCAEVLGAPHDIIDLSQLTRLIATSSLTSATVDVPEGHYAHETMRATVVPNRNMMMLSIAGAIAVAVGAQGVATGVHGGDHFIYPDCRPEFIGHTRAALIAGNDGFAHDDFQGVLAPYLHRTKADIVTQAAALGLDLGAISWSCYKGTDQHCGRCGTCVERAEAFHLAGVHDSTGYDDPDYWRTAA